jgi:hypothetical protein
LGPHWVVSHGLTQTPFMQVSVGSQPLSLVQWSDGSKMVNSTNKNTL